MQYDSDVKREIAAMLADNRPLSIMEVVGTY